MKTFKKLVEEYADYGVDLFYYRKKYHLRLNNVKITHKKFNDGRTQIQPNLIISSKEHLHSLNKQEVVSHLEEAYKRWLKEK